MRYLLLLFVLLSGCNLLNKKPTTPETPVVEEEDSIIISHTSATQDCGTNPYSLFDVEFADKAKLKEVKLRFIKIAKEKEPERIDPKLINGAIEKLNEDFAKYNFSFVADDITVIEDRRAFDEGINFYDKHARLYSEVGYINILLYPSNLDGGFSGAAVGIPSISIAVKEYYLNTSTVTHEMGHALMGLYHTHTLDASGIKNSYQSGDLVCGTPYADYFTKTNAGYIGRVTDDCEYLGPLENLTQEEHNANIRNIMSYSLSICRRELTPDQLDRGLFIIQNSQDHKEAIYIK